VIVSHPAVAENAKDTENIKLSLDKTKNNNFEHKDKIIKDTFPNNITYKTSCLSSFIFPSYRVKGRIFNVYLSFRNYNESYVYSINGVKSKTLHLMREHVYVFILRFKTCNSKDCNSKPRNSKSCNSCNYNFVFSKHPLHGKTQLYTNFNYTIDNSQVVILEADKSLPPTFYYQDKNKMYMGGLIQLHTKKEYEQRKQTKISETKTKKKKIQKEKDT
jgi:hypothetical protein